MSNGVIRLRFIQGGHVDSKVIQYTTRCEWSHVEALTDGLDTITQKPIRTLGAMLKGGVRFRSTNDPLYNAIKNYKIVEIPCTDAQEADFWRFLYGQVNKPYDWRAIIGFGLGTRDWREDDSWFCSELQTRGLETVGLVKLPAGIPVWRITPRDTDMLVTGLLQ